MRLASVRYRVSMPAVIFWLAEFIGATTRAFQMLDVHDDTRFGLKTQSHSRKQALFTAKNGCKPIDTGVTSYFINSNLEALKPVNHFADSL